MNRVLFLPLAAPRSPWEGDLATLLARQVPRQAAVLMAGVPGLEARFAILGREGFRPPGVPVRLAVAGEVARVVREAVQVDLVVDGRVLSRQMEFRLIRPAQGDVLWERRAVWSLAGLQRAVRGLAGGILEALGRTRGDLAPLLCRSAQAYFRFLRAEDMALQGRYAPSRSLAVRSLAAYRGAIQTDPTFPPAMEGLVRALSGAPREEALSVGLALVSLPLPPASQAWLARGLELLDRPAEADFLFRCCLSRDPDHPWAARHVGDALLSEGREQEALELWRGVAAAQRDDQSILGRLGALLRRLGFPAEAEAAYARLIGRSGVGADLWHAYGELLEERYGAREAARLLGSAMGDGVPAAARLDLGLLLVRAGRSEEAAALGRELAGSGGAEERRLGALLVAAARRPAALRLFRRGALLLEARRYAEACQSLGLVAREWPDLADAHYLLGSALLQADRPAEAVRSLRRCLALEPGFPEARSKLGIALVAQGLFQEAYEELAGALEDDPRSIGVLVHLAQACHYLDRYEEGAAYVLRARRLAPDHPLVERTAREFYASGGGG